MKNSTLAMAASAAILISGPAMAQSFTYDVTWEPVESVGGITSPEGTRYGGGTVNGTYSVVDSAGTKTNGKVRCVGMRQPDGSMFAIHMACSTTEEGASGALIYGCNYIGEPGPNTPLGCVGGMQGKEGPYANRRGSLTMEWYSPTQSRGTGQWYGE